MKKEELNRRERKELELRRQCNQFIIQLEMLISETTDMQCWLASNELLNEKEVDERLSAIQKMNNSLKELESPIKDLDIFSFRRGLIS